MKEIKQQGPMMLMDMIFTMPLFRAEDQKYKCIEVAEIENSSERKYYSIYFKEIPFNGYAVPEIVRLDIEIPNQSDVQATMYEKTDRGNYVIVCNGNFSYDDIKSVSGFQKIIIDLINK